MFTEGTSPNIRTAPVDCRLELVTTKVVVALVALKKVFHLYFFSACGDLESFNQVTPDASRPTRSFRRSAYSSLFNSTTSFI